MKRILLVALIMTIFLSISTVCAMENATYDDSNELNMENNDLELNPENEMISKGTTELEDSNIYVNVVDTRIVKDENLRIEYSNYENFKKTGNLYCYIDDEFAQILDITEYPEGDFYLDTENYTLGNHSCNICYFGNEQFKPFNKTFQFEISDVIIDFEDKVSEWYPYYIEAKFPDDADGVFTIKINDSKKTYYLNHIEVNYYNVKEISYSRKNLEYGTYNLEISYVGNYGNITRKANITKDYYFELCGDSLSDIYKYSFVFFEGVSKNVKVFIDGVDIKYDINDDIESINYNRPPNYYDGAYHTNAPIRFNKVSLLEGDHTLEVRYAGDSERPAKTLKETFHVSKSYIADPTDEFVNSAYPISIRFGENTTGNLSVYVSSNGKDYKLKSSVDIINGKAKTSIICDKVGKNYIKVIYNTSNGSGELYNTFNVIPAKVEFNKWIGVEPYYKETFTLKTGKKVTGTFSIYVNSKLYKSVKITKRTTKITVPDIFDKPGKYVIKAVWKTNYGSGKKSTKTIKLDHFVELKTVKVKKSAKKLTLQATITKNYQIVKNKQVTFKFNGKTYKAKTDSNGIAKVTIPKSVLNTLRVGKSVTYQATYLKDTVKKTVKIQK